MNRFWFVILVVLAALLEHCGSGTVESAPSDPLAEPGKEATLVDSVGAATTCDLGTIGYPVMNRRAYTTVYRNRGFYTDGNHLGLDLEYPEGTPVYPIGPGVVRVYRPATGYGTLVAVIEHCATLRFQATNGLGQVVTGQRFLTIYGHLRRTTGYGSGRTLAWSVGDRVTPYDVIGYIQRDSDNGDGAEHVHLGVRLQSMQEAIATDPSAWFRGYDGRPSQRRWFTDASRFYRELADQILQLDDPGAYTETPFPPPSPSLAPVDAGPPSADVMMFPDSVAVRDVGAPPPPQPVDAGRPPPSPSPPPMMPVMDAGSPPVDVLSPSPDLPTVPDVMTPVRPPETCNGLDDDGDGLSDEDFLCVLGRQIELCPTHCGSLGYIQCEAPSCAPGVTCRLFPERCTGGSDEDCDGLRDCADHDCMTDPGCVVRPPPPVMMVDAGPPPPDLPVPSPDVSTPSPPDVMTTTSGLRYEFRVLESSGWGATEPYRLRDRWWTMMRCENTGTTAMEARAEGWYRCDLRTRLTPFVGSFYSPLHPDWGDRGNLGTVGNSPDRCTPTEGVEWRLTDLASSREIFRGTSAELPCVAEGSQDRHRLP